MKEHDLRQILGMLGIKNDARASSKGWIAFRCPLAPWTHARGSDRRASAAAKIEEGKLSSWGCQSCHSHGTIHNLAYDYMMARDGRVDQAILDKCEQAEMGAMLTIGEFGAVPAKLSALPPAINETMAEGLYPDAYADPRGAAYLAGRGVSQETAEKLDLFFDEEDQRVLFPVRTGDGALYGFTGRAIDGREPRVKDYMGLPKRHVILGEHRWRSGMPKIIVEGLFAYAHLHEIGAEELGDIGALLGSELTPEKHGRIVSWGDPTFMLVDNDPAGDACLFGHKDTKGQHAIEEGAVYRLQDYVSVMVPAWPLWMENTFHQGRQYRAGDAKDDPDQLTFDEIDSMLQNTWPYVFPRRYAKRR